MVGAAEGDGRAVVSFHLGGQAFGIAAEHVAEVVPNAWLSRPPALPAMVAGLLDLGGEAVTVLRGDHLLGLPQQHFGLDASILIMKGSSPYRVGLLTGRVAGVRALQSGHVQPLDTVGNFRGCLSGQLVIDGVTINLLDWAKVLDSEERARLDEFQHRAAERLSLWQDGVP